MNIEIAVFILKYMYLPFIVQMLVLMMILMYKQRRRRLFFVWLVSGIPILCALTFFVSCLSALSIESSILNALGYVIVFVLILLLLEVCFNVPFKIILFFGINAYAVQNLCYRIGTLFEITGVVWRLSQYVGMAAATNIIYYGIFAAVVPLLWAVFFRRINARGVENIYSRNVLLISLFALAVTVVMCSFSNVYWWMSFQLSIINYCFAILANVFILIIQSGMAERIALRSDVEAVRRLWMADRRQYEIAKENIELINIKCHDMKHQLRALRSGGASEAEIAEIERCVAIYDSKINTGSEPLDVLLNEKSLLCNENGIRLDCMADGKLLDFMPDHELYSLFGNMLSNAIEAALKLSDDERKIISLTVRGERGMVFIDCENYYDGEVKTNGTSFITNKSDDSAHGFGVKSMNMLVKKYGGVMDIDFGGGVFSVKIGLPINAERLKIAA